MNDDRITRYKRWRENSAPYFRWQVAQFEPFLGRRVADIGCGAATLTPFLADRELYVGVDNDDSMLSEVLALKDEYPNLQTLRANVTEASCAVRLQRIGIDTIVSANTIEHIEDDCQALRVMTEALPSGGHLCLLVPSFQMLYGTLDSLDGHYRRYTRASLRTRICDLPLTIKKLYYFNALGAFGWWFKGRVLKERSQTDTDYRLMSIAVPLLRPFEAFCHPPIGLSLIAILQRH